MRWSTRRSIGAGLVVAASAAYAASFLPFLSDDALISLRYARRLLEGHGLTWTEGPPVEGYSNLSWVLGVASLGWLGLDLIDAARLLGAVCAAATLAALWSAPGERAEDGSARLWASLLYGTSATTAAWVVGGLEQPLVGACLSWALVGVLRLVGSPAPRGALMPGVAFALLCLTRPDSPLFVAGGCLSLWIAWRQAGRPVSWATLAVLAGLPLSAWGGQLAFRLVTYGEWVPNTALVKAHTSLNYLLRGGWYGVKGALSSWPLAVLTGLCWKSLHREARSDALAVLVVPAVLWSAYLVAIGGDIFPAYRHFTPLVVVGALSIAVGAGGWLAERGVRGSLGLAAIAGTALVTGELSPDVRRARDERWEWDGRDLARMLRVGFGGRTPLMAVSAAGCLPYWTGFPALDMLGLNDPYLPRHPPADFGRGTPGHELGSGAYVWSRRPDLIIFQTGTPRDMFRSGLELASMPEFLERYTAVTLRVPAEQPFDAVVRIDRSSPSVGLRREEAALLVPGYLIAGNPASRAVLSDAGDLVMRVEPGQPAWVTLPAALLPEPPWSAEASGDLSVRLRLAPEPNGDLRVVVEAEGVPARVRALVVSSEQP